MQKVKKSFQIDKVSKSEPKDDLSDKDYAVPKSFDDTTILDIVDNKMEQIMTKLAELQCRLKDSIILSNSQVL